MHSNVFLLLILGVLTSTTSLLIRYSRNSPGPPYIASVTVFLVEITKFLICIVWLFSKNYWNIFYTWRSFRDDVLVSKSEILRCSIPSFLYVILNNLLIVALSNLDAATFQVTYQLKIIWTAVFSRCLLPNQSKLSFLQWLSLFLLFCGIALVQTERSFYIWFEINLTSSLSAVPSPWTSFFILGHNLTGFTAVFVACILSGLSGVYFEKLLKTSKDIMGRAVYIKNLQMAISSVPLSFLPVIFSDLSAVKRDGLLQGFTPVVWVIIALQGVGGLVVAKVIKHMDNIVKGFATSVSLVFSCLISWMCFNDLKPGPIFVFGTFMVLVATGMYSTSGANAVMTTNIRSHLAEGQKGITVL